LGFLKTLCGQIGTSGTAQTADLVLRGVLGGLRAWRPLTYLAAAVGAGLTYLAVSDSCAMGMVLSKLPYNQGARGDVRAVLTQLAAME